MGNFQIFFAKILKYYRASLVGRLILSTFAPVKPKILHISAKSERSCVATIGSFDGVHRGHQRLISKVLEEARKRDLQSMVITFDKLPRQLFDADFKPQLLSTLDEKERLMSELGIDRLVVLPFTTELAALSAQAFMQQVLNDQLGVKVLVTGYDNRFGHNRSEGFEDYVHYGQEIDMAVIRGDVERFKNNGNAVSSSAIRKLLLEGNVTLAAEGLSRYYALTGTVVKGEHIGHKLGFPTANLSLSDTSKLIPATGAYAVWATINGQKMPAMMNIGMRPTFDGHKQTLEVHIMDDAIGDVYGQQLSVAFVARLRAEQRFDNREALVTQLEADRTKTLEILERQKI